MQIVTKVWRRTQWGIIILLLQLCFSIIPSYCGASPADDLRLASANNGFAFRLLNQLVSDQPTNNIFISPYSASTVLQMVCNGARGQTRSEMQQVLGIAGLEPGALNQAHKAVDTLLNEIQTNVIWKAVDTSQTNLILTTANAIWYRTGIVVKPTFIECNRQYFGAVVDPLDFDNPHSVDVMNSWAREKTHGRINGIADGLINPDTALFLANAVCFKGKWRVPFDVKNTKDRPFHLRNGQQNKIPMMEKADIFEYRRGIGYQAVRLPCLGGNLAMYVFLPDIGSSPEKLLNGDTWQRVARPGFNQRPGTVVLPRFKLEYGIELKRPLMALGMKAAFVSAKADFTGVSDDSLFVSAVRQRTFVEVNEEGTEAVAVTLMDAATGIEVSPPKPFEMIVDRPFLFLIEDHQTGTILFMGLVFDPQPQ